MQHSFDKNHQPLSVAFVCWQASPAIYPSSGVSVGGLETSAWLLACSLANLDGHCDRVSFVFRSNSATVENVVRNVALFPDYDPREWVRRDVSKAISNLRRRCFNQLSMGLAWKVAYLALTWPFRRRDLKAGDPDGRLSRISPDFWIAFGTSLESSTVMMTAKASNSRGILMIQSNADLDERYLSHPDARSAYGEVGADCVLALRNASLVVCQTELQREMLQNRFGIEGTVLPNAIDLEPWISAGDRRSKLPRSSEAKQVLWIGRYDRFHKRPMLCLEIARKCPAIQFRMIINGSDPTIEAEIHRDKPNNVSIVAYVPFDQMARTMSEADVLLFTGSRAYEGFPNVLLQAAATGCPVVSLEDFDGFLSKSEAGIVCGGDLEIASLAIHEYASGARTVDVERVRDYLAKHHGHTAIARKFRTLLHPPNFRN